MAACVPEAEIVASMRQAGASRLIGLIDPALPPLPGGIRERLSGVVCNAYAGARVGADAFVRLAPGEDEIFVARLLLDQSIAGIGAAPPVVTGSRLRRAVDRYWRSHLGATAVDGSEWGELAAPPSDPAPATGALAVLTHDATAPLCAALGRRGAECFGAAPVAALSPRFRHVLFMLGNTVADATLLRLLRRFGGDVVLADACLLALYDDRAATALAEAELGRPVPAIEMRQWRAGIARPSALLLAEVAESASRLFVSSKWLAREIAARYGRSAIVLPPARDGRQVCAHAAGLWAESCVWAVEMLAAWGEVVRLALVCPDAERAALAALAARLGVGDRVGFGGGVADSALFLAMRGQAHLSAALARTAGSGTPCIASVAVSEGVDADCAAILPDQPSPPLLAEAILRLLPAESEADRAATALLQAL